MVLFLSVIACKPSFPTYLAALNPTDQVFDFEELEYHYQVANRTEDVTSKGTRLFCSGFTDILYYVYNFCMIVDVEDDEDDADEMKNEKGEKDEKSDDLNVVDSVNATTAQNNSPSIDNPYLRAAKVPKKTKLEAFSSSSSSILVVS